MPKILMSIGRKLQTPQKEEVSIEKTPFNTEESSLFLIL